jgi:ABC-type branched-subunit amino acid transport system substrate-binding protein
LQATKQVLIPYRTVTCSPASTSPTITALNDVGLVFRTALSDSLQAAVLARIAATRLDHSSAATLYVNNDYGWQLSRSFARAFGTERDGTVTAQVPIEKGAQSYADALERARKNDPELLVLICYPDTGAQLLTDFYASGGTETVLVTDGLRDGTLHEDVDHSLDGVRGTAPLTAGPGRETFTQSYEEAYDREPGIFNAHAYDATAVLLLANAYAGRNDGAAIRRAIERVANPDGEAIGPDALADGLELAAAGEDVDYRGASSSVTFDENGDVTEAMFEFWTFDSSADSGISQIETVSST